MNGSPTKRSNAQLPMPGIPVPGSIKTFSSNRQLTEGQKVLYLGNVSGGPRYRTHGMVVQTLRNNALVDLGSAGTWHIPYYFLALHQAA